MASRRKPRHRPADGRAVRQGAEDAPRRRSCRPSQRYPELNTDALSVHEAGLHVLAHPSVAAKQFLITIGDRSVGGLTARDQMVGPWQMPVADCAITLTDFNGLHGEAMAIGERTPLALIDAAASARMAVGEAITNLLAAPIAGLHEVKLSANWMAAAVPAGRGRAPVRGGEGHRPGAVPGAGHQHSGRQGFAVDAVAVGGGWPTHALVVAGVAGDHRLRARRRCARRSRRRCSNATVDSELWLIGLGAGKQRMGGSASWRRCRTAFGGDMPGSGCAAAACASCRIDHRRARRRNCILAYHDRSDGGAFAALCEMAFASHCGLDIHLDGWGDNDLNCLFNEELGVLVQVAREDRALFADLVNAIELTHCAQRIAKPNASDCIRVLRSQETVAAWSWQTLFESWWSVTHAMQKQRDNPDGADSECDCRQDFSDPGLNVAAEL